MKKPILIAAGAVLLTAAVPAFVYVKNENNSMNELFNANVEALARGKTVGLGVMSSRSGNRGDHLMPRCTSCNETQKNTKLYYYVAFCN